MAWYWYYFFIPKGSHAQLNFMKSGEYGATQWQINVANVRLILYEARELYRRSKDLLEEEEEEEEEKKWHLQ